MTGKEIWSALNKAVREEDRPGGNEDRILLAMILWTIFTMGSFPEETR